jgi:hypothetical protein
VILKICDIEIMNTVTEKFKYHDQLLRKVYNRIGHSPNIKSINNSTGRSFSTNGVGARAAQKTIIRAKQSAKHSSYPARTVEHFSI